MMYTVSAKFTTDQRGRWKNYQKSLRNIFVPAKYEIRFKRLLFICQIFKYPVSLITHTNEGDADINH